MAIGFVGPYVWVIIPAAATTEVGRQSRRRRARMLLTSSDLGLGLDLNTE
jgi:hypothetical protein